ncbi:MAG: translation initiation factor IF-2 [Candidatus Nezhaarchaeales archaeon]
MGASFLPWSALEKICGPLLKSISVEIKIPGFLVIDTPGHEVFVNLRRRGGSIADMAILVIDILEGFEEITYECLEILKARKTPFVVAANKIDKIPGWVENEFKPFIETIKLQPPHVQKRLDELVYNIVAKFEELGFQADRYDRIRDFTRTVAIIPTSAKTGEGIPDLLLVLAGLSQRYMLKRLYVEESTAKGVVLECRELPGLGTVADVIIYDGILRKDDTIVLGGLKDPIVTKIRSLLMPKPMDEMRDPEDKFKSIDEVTAAAGVRIVAHGLDEAVAGSPLFSARSQAEIEMAIKQVFEEMAKIRITTDITGVVVKADTLGSLEALVLKLQEHGVPVRLADVGKISKRDVVEASITREKNPHYGVILAFNVGINPDADQEVESRGIPVFRSNVIYRLIDEYLEWTKKRMEEERRQTLSSLILPGKAQILKGYVFRRSDPAIVGVEILTGRLRPGYPLMNSKGRRLGVIMQIQEQKKSLSEAVARQAVAISIKGDVIIGRQVDEGDYIYVDVPPEHVRILKEKFLDQLSKEELELLDEIVKMRKAAGRY